jgi:hypothetical protein
MASKTPPKPAQLRDAFKQDLASCWQKARTLHPKDTPYAFVLHGLEGTPHLYPYVLTEEGLTQVAKRYVVQGYHETVAAAREELRYSIEDSPYAGELEDSLPTVDALVESHETDWDETEGYDLLANTAMQAFIALDKAGTFGKGRQREKLLLMIETSLAEKDWSAPSVKRLNSRSAFRRYEKETKEEGPYASADELAFSKDGRSLFYRGDREIDPRKEISYGELVACDVAGLKVKRKWHIRFSNFGANTVVLDCTANKTVVFIRNKSSEEIEDECSAILTRVAGGAKSGLKHTEIPTEALDGAITADGSRLAVLTPDKKLHFYDEKLKLLQTHKLQSDVSRLRFLKSGELVGIAKKQIVRLDSSLRMRVLPYRGNAFRMSFDRDERLCAVSSWPKGRGLISDRRPKDQFGFDLVLFPEMKVKRSFLIPGHELTWATLSQDGKYVACQARECGKYPQFVVVYDTKSGREIARRKLDSVREMAFVPGRNVLALSTSSFTQGEPIILWPLPS